MKRLYAGIDGGGTATRVAYRFVREEEMHTLHFGPFNFNSIGKERYTALLREITKALRERGSCVSLVIGAAGVSNEEMVKSTALVMEEAGLRNVRLVGDQVIAHAGAFAGGAGIAVIAGTGSVCYGKDEQGREAVTGGWGHLIGDEGSAYALGRDAVRAVTRMLDGCGEDTLLREMLAKEEGLHTRSDISTFVYGHDKSRLAALSVLVEQAAARKDPAAVRIIEENAALLCAPVLALKERLQMKETSCALLGGLFENDTAFRSAFVRTMAQRDETVCCMAPRADALSGALLMAERQVPEGGDE